jgi:hypothetical protein
MKVHKGCTGFASTRHYCSAPERLRGLEPQTTAHSTDWRTPETYELAVLNPLFFGRCGFDPPPRAPYNTCLGMR